MIRGDYMYFEFYVLNYDSSKKKVIPFNIFRNIYVQEYTEKEVKKYLRSPKNYVYKSFDGKEEIHGFDGLVKEIDGIIKWQEWGRREYEISVGDAFESDCDKLEKWDCYMQCEKNIEAITREVIYQYKQNKIKEQQESE